MNTGSYTQWELVVAQNEILNRLHLSYLSALIFRHVFQI